MAAALGLLVHAGDASAQANPPAPSPMPTPPAPPGDGATAMKILKVLEAGMKDERMAKVVAEPLGQAKRALERAHGARMAGDREHARLLDGLALEWAETARDLARAVATEDAALATARKAREVEVQVERARALLEETQARRGRAAAELERAEADAREAASRAATAEEERVKGGRTKGGAKAGQKGADQGKPDAKKGDTTPATKPPKTPGPRAPERRAP